MLKVAFERSCIRPTLKSSRLCARNYSALPRVAAPSFWQSLIPKPFRSDYRSTDNLLARPRPSSKPWNPATFFIFIFLLIGSNSINLLAVKQDFLSFSRQADAKIAALKEAIGKVQRGEEVDVKRLLGTGDPVAEQEWEEVLKELKQERPPLAGKKNKQSALTKQDNNTGDGNTSTSVKDEVFAKDQNNGQASGKVDFY